MIAEASTQAEGNTRENRSHRLVGGREGGREGERDAEAQVKDCASQEQAVPPAPAAVVRVEYDSIDGVARRTRLPFSQGAAPKVELEAGIISASIVQSAPEGDPLLYLIRFVAFLIWKLGGANGTLDFELLWKPPSNRGFVPCVEPSDTYSPPGESRGYLLVHTNGGLNQMRAGLDKKSLPIIRAAKSDSRLANNDLPPDIQKLRCRALYGALRFSPRIEALGKLLVERMRSYGPYIALHLRYEKDMLAFSGCTYGLSPYEADELTRIRENTAYWKVKDIDPREQRAKGYCPLTPKEVGMFLTALGYPPNTPVYIAAGEIYGGRMADLESRFPMLMSKEKLASVEELKPFMNHASQMAALDYIVSVESDVFIPSYSGNMARAVEGHRRFLGHRKTITPDRQDKHRLIFLHSSTPMMVTFNLYLCTRKALVHLFDKLSIKEGKKLSELVVEIHKKRQGSPRRRKGPVSGTRGKERFRSEMDTPDSFGCISGILNCWFQVQLRLFIEADLTTPPVAEGGGRKIGMEKREKG
ncbi:hypothetical protein ACLOJK_016367 [Asimina triloba]